jgi:hypothetical protein
MIILTLLSYLGLFITSLQHTPASMLLQEVLAFLVLGRGW